MFKKGISLILAALFITLLSTATFAGIQLNPVEPEDIELVAPKIGSERQVFVKDSMAISIRSVKVDVSLFKVMPSSHDSYLDEACESEMVMMADEVPFRVVSGGSIIARDAFVSEDEAETSKDLSPVKTVELSDAVDSDEIIDGSQALLQVERLSSKDRQDVIQSYNTARKAFGEMLLELESAYAEYIELFPQGHVETHAYTREELSVIKNYLTTVDAVQSNCGAYIEAKEGYEAIFEIPLFGPEDVSNTGILPYYQKTVEKITPGLYKFVFTDQENQEMIKVIEFEVTKKEELTEKVIKEAMPSNVGDLILPSVDLIDSTDDNVISDDNEGKAGNNNNSLDLPADDNKDE